MYLCYIDESGTPDVPGNTSHFVLAGLSVPISRWKQCDSEISSIKRDYDIQDSEIHTAWILRKYIEQIKIKNFESHTYSQRRSEVEQLRKAEMLRLQRVNKIKLYRQTQKNYEKTAPYVHLTFGERKQLIKDLANRVSKWWFARLFAECINKIYFDPTKMNQTTDEQAFEQVVSRFEQYLEITANKGEENFGLLIHDNNPTVSKKHTVLMKRFYSKGTLWKGVKNIIETPLFVDSELTSMVQIADLCGYTLRRYLENNEQELFNLIFSRADRKYGVTVGVRHFSNKDCGCRICEEHTK